MEKPHVANATRFFGLDIHKFFMVAVAVDREKAIVYGPRRVEWLDFERWIEREIRPSDAVVIEMTTNTWEVYDLLIPHTANVLVVHPQHVKAIVEAQVKTDRKAAQTLAELLSAGMLHGIWVPDEYTRDLRILTSQRKKMGRLGAIAKNRLHAVLHRHHILPPEGFELFHPNLKPWWEGLKVSPLEKVRIQSDLATLAFAQSQKVLLEAEMGKAVANEERIPLLIQVPGVALLTAVTILAAIGDITRFPDAQHLVGYAGLGARVHDGDDLLSMLSKAVSKGTQLMDLQGMFAENSKVLDVAVEEIKPAKDTEVVLVKPASLPVRPAAPVIDNPFLPPAARDGIPAPKPVVLKENKQVVSKPSVPKEEVVEEQTEVVIANWSDWLKARTADKDHTKGKGRGKVASPEGQQSLF